MILELELDIDIETIIDGAVVAKTRNIDINPNTILYSRLFETSNDRQKYKIINIFYPGQCLAISGSNGEEITKLYFEFKRTIRNKKDYLIKEGSTIKIGSYNI